MATPDPNSRIQKQVDDANDFGKRVTDQAERDGVARQNEKHGGSSGGNQDGGKSAGNANPLDLLFGEKVKK